MARHLGVWESSLRQFEQGKGEPDLNTLIQVSDKLNIPIDALLKKDLEGQQKRLRRQKLKLVLLDVDGTLTDGGLYYTGSGDQFKCFNVKDGMAIRRVEKFYPVKFGFISGSSAISILKARAEALNVAFVYGGNRPKVKVIEEWLGQLGISWKQVAYIGDDVNDIPAIKRAGLSACPADAEPAVRAAVNIILDKRGGEGCVREFLQDVLGYDLEGNTT